VVVIVAVQDAAVVLVDAVGVHFTAAPRLVLPFENCTVPVGPCDELLFVPIVAVSVTLVPGVNDARLDDTAVAVAAFVIVTASVLLGLEL
jgi:hypothetical protein